MRRKTALLAAVLAALLLPAPALAQTVSEGLIEVVGTLDLDALVAAAEDVPWLEGGVEQVITRLASGQAALTADEALRWLMDEAAGVLRRSVWRITRLLVPALLVAAAELIAAFWLAHSDYVQTREESLDDLRAPSSDTESTGGEGNHVVS